MTVRIAYIDPLELSPPPGATDAQTYLLDLALPCPLACAYCERRERSTSSAALQLARRRLVGGAERPDVRALRAVLYGGDPFLAPQEVAATVREAVERGRARGAAVEVHAISPGVTWTPAATRALCAAGVTVVQVNLAGMPADHDRLRPLRRGGGSFAGVLHALKFCRDALEVVVRLEARRGDPVVEEVAGLLEGEGLFAPPRPVRLLVGPRTSYRDQARQLLALRADGSGESR